GLGRSGAAAASLAAHHSGKPFVSDSAPEKQLESETSKLRREGIPYEAGGHTDRLLEMDYVVISPGIPPETEIVQKLSDQGTPVFSELEFASWLLPGKMIAVSGSNGKTTTATMIDGMIRADRRPTFLCGNIGSPLSACVTDIPRDGVAVVEVSSYQLEYVDQFSPDVALIINLTPNHLERHGSLAKYREMKLRISGAQTADDKLALNINSPDLDPLSVHTAARVLLFGPEEALESNSVGKGKRAAFLRGASLFGVYDGAEVKICDTADLRVPGAHNVENALAAASAALAFGVGPNSVRSGLLEFNGVEHRLEYVAEVNGVRLVNDSKATNLDATIKALEATDGRIGLILGGRAKGEDFSQLAPHIAGRVGHIVALGESKEAIFAALGKDAPVEFASSMSEAVTRLFDLAKPGETILLSPGCASFDMYRDFEQRGADFKRSVLALKDKKETNAVES
ncbi:MAG: UDP-N-acetylmuramoyl-L-alanine--D-glutamate ligase, partial [Candidatus Zixiibacteriota bacterium]